MRALLLALLLGGCASAPDPRAQYASGLLYVEGDSMRPGIEGGSVRFLNRDVPFEEVRIGDLIAWWSRRLHRLIVHRVVDVRRSGDGRRYVITKGDANPAPDAERTTVADYVGIVVPNLP